MDEYIKVKDLVDMLEQRLVFQETHGFYRDAGYTSRFIESIADIPHIDVAPKSEWISVEERLPKKRQKCLCYYPEKDYGSKVVVDYAETDNGGFAEQFRFGKPSHWMPLPEAPKKGGAEE
jgi:hypothetical protein